jgi:magnesium-transporting ATPase (P-type)
MIVAIVFVNWAIFTWLAYSVATKENKSASVSSQSQGVSQDKSRQDWKTLMDVTTFAYQIVILLALIFLNVLLVVGVTDTACLVGAILVSIVVPLLVTLVANKVIKREGS